jgi:hypothetical protein
MRCLECPQQEPEVAQYFRNHPWLEAFRRNYDIGTPIFLSKTEYEIALKDMGERLQLDLYTLACVDALVEYYIHHGEYYSQEYSLDLLCAVITFVSKLSDEPNPISTFYPETFNNVMVIFEFELLRLCWENKTGFFMELWN